MLALHNKTALSLSFFLRTASLVRNSASACSAERKRERKAEEEKRKAHNRRVCWYTTGAAVYMWRNRACLGKYAWKLRERGGIHGCWYRFKQRRHLRTRENAHPG
jgi:hypothetical protein